MTHLKDNHKRTIIHQLEEKVIKRYPANWKTGDKYASFINHSFDLLRDD